MRYRFRCAVCGDGRKTVYWSDSRRERLLARCLCGANFHGPGIWLPLEWATSSVRGLSVEVDPHADHSHGHGKCDRVEQGTLPL